MAKSGGGGKSGNADKGGGKGGKGTGRGNASKNGGDTTRKPPYTGGRKQE